MFNALGSMVKVFVAAIYIRLSKEDDNLGESESIQNQKTLLTKYIKEQGYTIYDIYIDDGYTGTNFERPAFQRMLKDIENRKVNMVITKDLSRLSRDYIGTGEYIEKWFPAHNVRYVALTDNIDTFVDSTNNDIAPFKAILNDMYAKDLSKKIRTALHTMQSEGKWVGGCPPFGYKVDPNDKNHLVPDEIEAPIIKRIYDLFVNQGKRINQIRDILNNEKVPTFSTTRNRNFERKGNGGNIYGCWSNITLKKILSNKLYTGDMIQNRRSRVNYKYRKVVCNPKESWIIVENTHEALVDKTTFEKAQKLLPKQQKRSDKKGEFLFDGLIKCADCGHNISIQARRSNGKSTTVCNYYRKYKGENRLCTSHGFDYDTIEKGVIDITRKIISNLNNKSIVEKVKKKYDNNNTMDNINKNIIKLKIDMEKSKNNLDNMYIDKLSGKIDEDMYNRVSNKLNNEINDKENKIKDMECYIKELENQKASIKDLKVIVNEFIDLRYLTRDLILKLINNICIHKDGNIDIYFNFKELNIINETYNA